MLLVFDQKPFDHFCPRCPTKNDYKTDVKLLIIIDKLIEEPCGYNKALDWNS